jgi:hypothetical protein
MAHKYDKIVKHLADALDAVAQAGLDDVLPKGGVGTILLAHRLDHELVPGDKGADAQDSSGKKYEYKVSITNQFNFHFGARKASPTPAQTVKKHFAGLDGAYCARRDGGKFTRIVFCPVDSLVEDLCTHFGSTTGGQLNKNFRLESFAALKGAKDIK